MRRSTTRRAPLLLLLAPQLALASVCYQVQSTPTSSPESLCVTPLKQGGVYKISQDSSLSRAEMLSGRITAYYRKKGNLFVKLGTSSTSAQAQAPDAYHFDMPLGDVGGIEVHKSNGPPAALHVLGASQGTYDNQLHQIRLLEANDQVCADCGSSKSEIGVEKKLVENTAQEAVHAVSVAGSLPTKVELPGGASFIYEAAADPENPETIFALAERNGGLKSILKSSDGGKHWTEVSALDKTYGFADLYSHIAVAPGGKDIFFNSEHNLSWIKGTVFHSSDGGKTFAALEPYDGEPSYLRLSPDGKTLLVSVQAAYSNADPKFQDTIQYEKSGDNWVRKSTQLPSLKRFFLEKRVADPRCVNDGDTCPYAHPEIFSLAFDPRDPGVIYAGTGNHVYRYSSGQGWEVLSNGVYNDTTVYNIEVAPKTNQIAISGCNGVYHASATARSENVRFSKYTSPNFILQGKANISTPNYLRAFGIAINPKNSDQQVAVAASGVYLSKDSGKTWQRVHGGELVDRDEKGFTQEFRSATWLPDGSVMVSGVGAGAFTLTP